LGQSFNLRMIADVKRKYRNLLPMTRGQRVEHAGSFRITGAS
jgi:hypothetical protein